MKILLRSRYVTRYAADESDVRKAQALRFKCFVGGEGVDADQFDSVCKHVLVEELSSGKLVCCFRFLPLENGSEIARSYSAQFYELSRLARYQRRMVEMGRFCIDADCKDPGILRAAWGAMTAYVDENDVGMLFGCSSFKGTKADEYFDAFALLKDRHLAPSHWLPKIKAPSVFRFASRLRLRQPDLSLAMRAMPPLLRTYLMMGGWVSDHAVIDRDLGTLHVFTGVEVKSVPAHRVRSLRAVAG